MQPILDRILPVNLVLTTVVFYVAATIYNAPIYMGATYWIPAFWVPALLVTHYITFIVLTKYKIGGSS